MTRPNLEKIQARLDATNDARTPPNERELANLKLYANARRDLCLCLDYIKELELHVRDLRDRANRSESPTSYAVIRPVNDTVDLPKVLMDTGDLGRPAGLRDAPPPIPRMDTKASQAQNALRVLSQLIEQIE